MRPVYLSETCRGCVHRIVHEVDDPNGAGLLTILSTKIQQALKNTAPNAQANRNRESRRFLREAQLLWTHKDYAQGLQAAETAFALKPSDDARTVLAHLPNLEKVALPWESVKTLVGIQDLLKMKADLLIATTVHDKHIYYFTGRTAEPAK